MLAPGKGGLVLLLLLGETKKLEGRESSLREEGSKDLSNGELPPFPSRMGRIHGYLSEW